MEEVVACATFHDQLEQVSNFHLQQSRQVVEICEGRQPMLRNLNCVSSTCRSQWRSAEGVTARVRAGDFLNVGNWLLTASAPPPQPLGPLLARFRRLHVLNNRFIGSRFATEPGTRRRLVFSSGWFVRTPRGRKPISVLTRCGTAQVPMFELVLPGLLRRWLRAGLVLLTPK